MKRCLTLLVLVAACGEVKPSSPPQKEALEVTSGGGRLRSATYTFEVQIGHPLGQSTVQGSTFTLEGNAAVRP